MASPHEVFYFHPAANPTREGSRNCAEQSAVALFYLKNKGIERVQYFNRDRNAPQLHQFVVISRPASSHPERPETWGAQCGDLRSMG